MHSKQGILFLAGLLLVSFCESKFAMRQHAAFPVKQKNVHLSPSPQDPGLDQQDYVSVASSIPRGGGHGTTMSFAISLVGLVCAQVIAGLQLLQLFNDPFNWGLPSIDGKSPLSPNECSSWDNEAFLSNIGLYLLWVVQHSGMSRPRVKQMLGLYGRVFERGVFGCATALVWGNLVLKWRPIQTCTTWALEETPLPLALLGGGMVVWGLINMVSSMVCIPDHIFGITGHYNDPNRTPTIIYTYPYSMIRHPGSGGFLFFLWGFALMAQTVNYVVYAGMWTLFVLLGTYFEEKALRREFGPAYDFYANQVPAFCPKLSFFLGARPSAPKKA